jgi:transcriptional regulator with XRE-family HTH domain
MSQALHTVGTKVKKLRELRNFTQSYMAERLGIAQSSYSTIESGESDITLSRLDEISKILGMRLEDVMAFDEKMVFNIATQNNTHNGFGFVNHNRLFMKLLASSGSEMQIESFFLKVCLLLNPLAIRLMV